MLTLGEAGWRADGHSPFFPNPSVILNLFQNKRLWHIFWKVLQQSLQSGYQGNVCKQAHIPFYTFLSVTFFSFFLQSSIYNKICVLFWFLESHSGNKMSGEDVPKADPSRENVLAWGSKHGELSAWLESVKLQLGLCSVFKAWGDSNKQNRVTHQGDFPLWFQQLRFMERGGYGGWGNMSRV